MKCAFHTTEFAVSQCTSCRNQLCAGCDHRIKGSTYCQDCIVRGIEFLQRASDSTLQPGPKAKSPVLASIFSIIPGLGAAYNGQIIKSLVHFVMIVGLWALFDVFHNSIGWVFFLAGVGLYIFAIYDALQSARRQNLGEDIIAEDKRLKDFVRSRTSVWGGIILFTGILIVTKMIFPYLVNRFWPVLLIVAGIVLIIRGFETRGSKKLPNSPPHR